MNPDFYQGTAVEAPVGKLMADKRRTPGDGGGVVTRARA